MFLLYFLFRNLKLLKFCYIIWQVNYNLIQFKNKLENYQKTGLYYPVGNQYGNEYGNQYGNEYSEEIRVPLDQLRNLNPTIHIGTINILDEDKELDKNIIRKYNLVILTNSIIDDGLDINKITHKLNIPFIMCGSYGLMGYVFNDFGEKFVVNDIDGEIPEPLILESVA